MFSLFEIKFHHSLLKLQKFMFEVQQQTFKKEKNCPKVAGLFGKEKLDV